MDGIGVNFSGHFFNKWAIILHSKCCISDVDNCRNIDTYVLAQFSGKQILVDIFFQKGCILVDIFKRWILVNTVQRDLTGVAGQSPC